MIHHLNYLNAAAYLLNAAVTYLVGTYGVLGPNTQNDLSEKYQTLVTPAGFAFSIWGIIFASQFIFVVAQLLIKKVQSKGAVGVGYNYIGVCIAQAAWVIVFNFEIIWLSLPLMLTILYFLLKINVNQYYDYGESTIRNFWLFHFPFSIHCGWILAASFVNLNVVLVKYSVGSSIQYYAALVSLLVLFHGAILPLVLLSKPQYVIPSVLSWALYGIYSELQDPKELILNTFTQSNISSIKNKALYAMITILTTLVIRLIIELIKKLQSENDHDENNTSYVALDDNNDIDEEGVEE
eukprot:CAMPEP_0178914970 /NCGR_PEP_ID=MMETSP0786-20121207/11743_1 /TAXON_ID=186022 /ORGANISM="Thalassionema frauenfeldii, Strain CCMP 1798" /LENGTH=294 /DNA_ID=CAMNT_0020587981 /DNA_START=66 /DNA_END=950 /DNA_ORIENTATION=-